MTSPARTPVRPSPSAFGDQPFAAAFQRVRATFDVAARARPDALTEVEYTFAGHPATLRVVGSVLGDHVRRPLEHLRAERSDRTGPGLSIDLWDEIETEVACPFGPSPSAQGSHWQIVGGQVRASPDARYVQFRQLDAVTWLDRHAWQIVGWRPSGESLSWDERTKPIPLLLQVWYADRGVHSVHAALVSRRGHGALISGPNGSGKSTTAFACLSAGFLYLGDDRVGVQDLGERGFVGHSLYGYGRLADDQLERLPSLEAHAIPGHGMADRKAFLYLAEFAPERVGRSVPIRVVLLPRVTGGEDTRYRPASRRDALLQMAPSSLIVPLGGGREGLDRLQKLVEQVPVYWLELGTDLEQIPRRVEELLDRATA